MGRLDGKVAVISGTGSGQGRAAAILFAKEGAIVVGCDISARGAEQTVEMVTEAGGTMVSKTLDATDEAQIKAWVDEAAERFGGIDILYNNASAATFGSFARNTPEEYEFTLKNEIDIVFYPTRAVWPHMIARGGGSIINTASIMADYVTVVPLTLHGMCKGAVRSFSVTTAVEGGPHGIRVNTISPGMIATPPLAAMMDDPNNAAQRHVRASPLGRKGYAEDVASVALFLASDDSSFVTGEEIVVDGGQRLVIGLQFGDEPESTEPHANPNDELRGTVEPAMTIDVKTPAGTADCYVFTPQGATDGSWPGVLLYHDLMGVRPVFMHMAQRIADAGYTVMMPNLYYRIGPPLDPPLSVHDNDQLQTLIGMSADITKEAIEADAPAFAEALHGLPTVADDAKLGCVGYCMSGPMAVWSAGAAPDEFGAVATWHGAEMARETPDSPALIAAGTPEIRYFFGLARSDPFMMPDRIELLRETLDPSDTEYDAEIFADTFHGFAVLDASYNETASEAHYDRIAKLFRESLPA